MEQLLNAVKVVVGEAQKLCTAMQNAINYANNITREADAKLKTASDLEAKMEAWAKGLTERETKVSKIENVVKLGEDTKILMKEATELQARLESEKSAFNQTKTEAMRKIASETAKIADDNAMLVKEWDIYKKREAELKKKEEDYKERIAKSIVDNVKAR